MPTKAETLFWEWLDSIIKNWVKIELFGQESITNIKSKLCSLFLLRIIYLLTVHCAGVTHGDDLGSYFNMSGITPGYKTTDPEYAVVKLMTSFWYNFAAKRYYNNNRT
jgi:carboxylesterase type B